MATHNSSTDQRNDLLKNNYAIWYEGFVLPFALPNWIPAPRSEKTARSLSLLIIPVKQLKVSLMALVKQNCIMHIHLLSEAIEHPKSIL